MRYFCSQLYAMPCREQKEEKKEKGPRVCCASFSHSCPPPGLTKLKLRTKEPPPCNCSYASFSLDQSEVVRAYLQSTGAEPPSFSLAAVRSVRISDP
jgi:hypothetical protein